MWLLITGLPIMKVYLTITFLINNWIDPFKVNILTSTEGNDTNYRNGKQLLATSAFGKKETYCFETDSTLIATMFSNLWKQIVFKSFVILWENFQYNLCKAQTLKKKHHSYYIVRDVFYLPNIIIGSCISENQRSGFLPEMALCQLWLPV